MAISWGCQCPAFQTYIFLTLAPAEGRLSRQWKVKGHSQDALNHERARRLPNDPQVRARARAPMRVRLSHSSSRLMRHSRWKIFRQQKALAAVDGEVFGVNKTQDSWRYSTENECQ
mmetsp:Transcript_66325/g.107599  ORF Transcript_66325/g.107599 Transcript_66325/m.107599 type:complete len:116 (-) Transcript_66325:104-451(-)